MSAAGRSRTDPQSQHGLNDGNRAVGVAPMEYLLAWRMAMAKDLLGRKEAGVAEVAERVGYSSASSFSVAFTRYVGLPPTRYARQQMESRAPRSAGSYGSRGHVGDSSPSLK